MMLYMQCDIKAYTFMCVVMIFLILCYNHLLLKCTNIAVATECDTTDPHQMSFGGFYILVFQACDKTISCGR